jgi:hypothetical protein
MAKSISKEIGNQLSDTNRIAIDGLDDGEICLDDCVRHAQLKFSHGLVKDGVIFTGDNVRGYTAATSLVSAGLPSA